MKCFLRSQLSSLSVLCVDDHILNSFHSDVSTGNSSERSHASAKSWSPLPMSDFKGFGTRIGRETRETKENNEKLSLTMADCIFEKLQHQMQKQNDIIKSNENLAKVR